MIININLSLLARSTCRGLILFSYWVTSIFLLSESQHRMRDLSAFVPASWDQAVLDHAESLVVAG